MPTRQQPEVLLKAARSNYIDGIYYLLYQKHSTVGKGTKIITLEKAKSLIHLQMEDNDIGNLIQFFQLENSLKYFFENY